MLQVINSSPGDLGPVFDAMLEKAIHLCEAAFGDLGIFDGEQYRWVAAHGIPDFAEYSFPLRPDGNSPMEQLTRGERLVHLADVRQSDAYRELPAFKSTMDRRAVRSLLVVPLRKDGALLGAIRAYRQEVRPFSDKQIALMQNFAAQAVIAMENARLLTETREALEQQTATAEVLQVINSSPGDLAPVFETILEKAHTLCGATYGGLVIRDRDGFHNVAARGDPQFVERWRQVRPLHPPPGSPLTRLMRGEKVIHLADASADDSYRNTTPPEIQELVEFGGLRTLLMVPLRTDNAFLGVITAYRLEVQPFTDKQIALLQNFAAQAVIAMENARLLTETREALEQQTATAEVLQVINSSPGDLAPVFDAMLEKAHSLCGADFGALKTYDGEFFRHAAARSPSASPRYAELMTADFRPGVDSVVARLVSGERFVHDFRFGRTLPRRRHTIGRHIWTAAALRSAFALSSSCRCAKTIALLGAITANRREVQPFTDKQIALLENFAAQAVIAMENARLITETREALEQQTATAEVLQVINSSPGDLAPVFDAMLEKATRLCEAPFGTLRTWDGECFHLGAVHGEPTFRDWVGQRGPIRPDGDASPLGRIQAGERVVRVADEPGDEGYWNSAGFRKWVEASGIRRGIWVALRKDDELLGTITVFRKEPRPFSEKQIALLENFAAQAVIAMENARLLGELRQRTDEVAELNRGLEARVAEQVEELGRVGRLKRFLAPQLAELIVSQGDEKILESHRREIVVVFCDLRGYTAFTETAEPEEVLEFLREYHGALGPLVAQFEGTLDQFSGDGIMVFFNDPGAVPRPGRARGQDGDGDARGSGQADCRLAPPQLRAWFWRRHRAGLRDPGPDRLFRTLRLHRDRHGLQPCRPALCRGQGRADPGQQPHR